jgi:3,4-dihydroxy 2-butanone 4-phosphate synthase / GTP cyclohydrolase II
MDGCERIDEGLLAAVRAGGPLVLSDDLAERGASYLCVAAAAITPRDLDYLDRRARGLLRVAVSRDQWLRLGLEHSGQVGSAAEQIAMVGPPGIEAGPSARERCLTVRHLAAASSVRAAGAAGNVLAFGAAADGLFERLGIVEAATDLAALAAAGPAMAVKEILGPGGETATIEAAGRIAREDDLPHLRSSDVLAARRACEPQVELDVDAFLPTRHGEFRAVALPARRGSATHIALIAEPLEAIAEVPVYVHEQCRLGEAFRGAGCDCGRRLERMLDHFGARRGGVVLYLTDERGADLLGRCPATTANPERRGLAADAVAALGLGSVSFVTEPPAAADLAADDRGALALAGGGRL